MNLWSFLGEGNASTPQFPVERFESLKMQIANCCKGMQSPPVDLDYAENTLNDLWERTMELIDDRGLPDELRRKIGVRGHQRDIDPAVTGVGA